MDGKCSFTNRLMVDLLLNDRLVLSEFLLNVRVVLAQVLFSLRVKGVSQFSG